MLSDFRLIVFIKTVEKGSFTKAAKALQISQPAVSQHIAELEKEIGDTIFIRNKEKNVIQLTPKGEILYDYSKKITHLYNNISNELIPTYSRPIEQLYISATPIISQYILPEILEKFKKSHPYIELILTSDDDTHIIENIDKQEIDIGIISELHPVKAEKIHISPFASISLTSKNKELKKYNIIYSDNSNKKEYVEHLLLSIETYV